MSIIALFNAAKDYFHRRHLDRGFRHLDDHYLQDLGFYRDEGHIRPLSGKKESYSEEKEEAYMPSGKTPNDE